MRKPKAIQDKFVHDNAPLSHQLATSCLQLLALAFMVLLAYQEPIATVSILSATRSKMQKIAASTSLIAHTKLRHASGVIINAPLPMAALASGKLSRTCCAEMHDFLFRPLLVLRPCHLHRVSRSFITSSILQAASLLCFCNRKKMEDEESGARSRDTVTKLPCDAKQHASRLVSGMAYVTLDRQCIQHYVSPILDPQKFSCILHARLHTLRTV